MTTPKEGRENHPCFGVPSESNPAMSAMMAVIDAIYAAQREDIAALLAAEEEDQH